MWVIGRLSPKEFTKNFDYWITEKAKRHSNNWTNPEGWEPNQTYLIVLINRCNQQINNPFNPRNIPQHQQAQVSESGRHWCNIRVLLWWKMTSQQILPLLVKIFAINKKNIGTLLSTWFYSIREIKLRVLIIIWAMSYFLFTKINKTPVTSYNSNRTGMIS